MNIPLLFIDINCCIVFDENYFIVYKRELTHCLSMKSALLLIYGIKTLMCIDENCFVIHHFGNCFIFLLMEIVLLFIYENCFIVDRELFTILQ